MADYRYVAAELAHPGTTIADLPLTGVSWGRMLNGAAEFRGNLKFEPAVDEDTKVLSSVWRDATDRGRTCIYVLRDGVPLGCYATWSTTYSSEDQTLSLGGAELFSYARRRIIEGPTLTTPINYTGRPIDIAKTLLLAVNEIGLQLDIGEATGGTSGSRTYVGTDDRKVSDEVLELAGSTAGFDFRSDVRIGSGGTFERVWLARPALGGTTEIVAKYGTNVAKLDSIRRGDTRANDAIVLGSADAAGGGTRPSARSSTPDWRPTLTTSVAVDETDSTVLTNMASSLLAAHRDQDLFAVEVVASEFDAQPGTFHPGDVMRLVVNPGDDPYFHEGLDTSVRTLGYTVAVPDTGGVETITMIFDEGG